MRIRALLASAILFAFASLVGAQQLPAPQTPNPPLFKGERPKKEENTRSVSGVVRDPSDNLKGGAIVKLKDTKSLAIRSFITKDDGAYNFQGLSNSVNYELKAESREGEESSTKTLTVYDNRKAAIINLKLEAKKK
ncbi:MAG: carboxypeptidase-like regulatory domain-containing protein [Bryobacter sp.]|nr:carboxypeptidase-like regulatory domain-containing protein [Bryobacter sp.]